MKNTSIKSDGGFKLKCWLGDKNVYVVRTSTQKLVHIFIKKSSRLRSTPTTLW